MSALQQYLQRLRSAYVATDPDAVLAGFRIDPPTFHALKAHLTATPSQDLTAVVLSQIPLASSPFDSERFQTLVAEYLSFIRDHQHISNVISPFSSPFAPASSQASPRLEDVYDAWALVYSRASTFFSLPDTTWFIPTLRYLAASLVSLAMTVDQRMGLAKKPKTTDAAGRLSKSAGMAGNDRSQARGSETKRAAVLMLANLSFKAYFKLNNTRLCETVLGSVENALKLNRSFPGSATRQRDDTGEACYSRADRVTYRYYLGRLRLFQHSIKAAATHLRWAFDNCPNQHLKNKRLILIPLISTYLILGRYPDETLLSISSLTPQFSALVRNLRLGNGAGVNQELDRHMDWFRVHGLYLILKEKLPISVWRNLARRCLVISRSAAPPSAAPPTLGLAQLHQVARLAWQEPELEVEDVEAILTSLVDQGFVKGYILHSKNMLVLQKGPHLGFPPIWSVFEGR
ncbi:uncharacterized protein PFL1_03609 [Pseudozyma flocculosa PF-1]|uniref:Related to protein that forms a complex with Thp3p n=2 Tax=Pseudozyma flocculosa TaxID=84751 RepID=A0A5C3F6I9_9BASI|nr:uncharacterized protein PFL1_03609 [Pseudozyma flocculosa PF-1]EPQ28806.1 hypothetical protein PFL1_03609 [Pseudozyma flocculosa PF-1]SPO39405.1 related to protein that forms a complex with Thp3p [Pseudozyma flocculosa]